MNNVVDKDNLAVETVLQINGHDNNTYCIVGKSISSWDMKRYALKQRRRIDVNPEI